MLAKSSKLVTGSNLQQLLSAPGKELQNYTHIHDAELLALLRNGDALAFKELFDRHYDDLFAQAFGRLGEFSAYADDIVQQVFIDFWSGRKFEAVEGNVKSYLAGMMHHKVSTLVRNEQRKQQQLGRFLEQQEEESFPESEEDRMLLRRLQEEIMQLPDQCRRVFILAYIEENTYQQVADEMGISKNTVKTYMKSAMAKLRVALKHGK